VKYREALLLSASGDHTFDEIGKLLGIPTGTAKWRAMEGRRILKKKLVSRGFGRESAGAGAELGIEN
jgi:DNA-directed RNA polymerase specialized sigma24 family protein